MFASKLRTSSLIIRRTRRIHSASAFFEQQNTKIQCIHRTYTVATIGKKRTRPVSMLSKPKMSSSTQPKITTTEKKPGEDDSTWFMDPRLLFIIVACSIALAWDDDEEADDKPLYLSRKQETPRYNWKETFNEIGFPFADYPGVPSDTGFGMYDSYWNEKASYQVHPFGRWMLESAAFQIHSMCLEAANEVIASDELLEKFEIPRDLWDAIRISWNARQTDIGGRMDLLWDGSTPPKLAEYNADTPTVLIESSIAQENWFQEVYGSPGEGKLNNKNEFTQFNAIKSAMEEAFKRIKRKSPKASIIFTTNGRSVESEFLEERSTSIFMQNCAKLAGLPTEFVDIEALDEPNIFESLLKAASSGSGQQHSGGDGSTTDAPLFIWKLYPYEWLIQEKLGVALTNYDFLHGNLQWLEPPWKLVLSSKAMLAYLWEKHQGHPNLLPTYWDFDQVHKVQQSNKEDGWVAKPRFGREGVGIMYSDDYDSWQNFSASVKTASQSVDVSGFNFDSNTSDWNSGSTQTTITYLTDGNGESSPSVASLLRYVEPYIGSFDLASVESLRERDWGSMHSKEESPTFGFFVGKPIFQKYHRPARLDGRTVVTSAWIVNGLPVGICFREDRAITTNDDSCFVPHVVTKGAAAVKPEDKFDFVYPITPVQRRLREELYGTEVVGSASNAKMTYDEYLRQMENGPVGVSDTGGGGSAPIVRTSYRYYYGNNSNGNSNSDPFWFVNRIRKWARGEKSTSGGGEKTSGDQQKAKSSSKAGSKGSQAAVQAAANRSGGGNKGRQTSRGRIYRSGATARGASYKGRSGRS